MPESNSISFEKAFEVADHAVFEITQEHLTDAERIVLKGTWEGQEYEQIAETCEFSDGYLKSKVGPKLWKNLTTAFGEKVNKKNVRVVLEQQWQLQSQKDKKFKAHRKNSNRASPSDLKESFEQLSSLTDQIKEVVNDLLPIKAQKIKEIVGAAQERKQKPVDQTGELLPSKTDTTSSSSTATPNEAEILNEYVEDEHEAILVSER